MSKSKPGAKEIYLRLAEIEHLLKQLLKEEEFIKKDGWQIKKSELKEIELLRQLKGNDIKRTYSDITEWKEMIWENCPDKESEIEKKTIDYMCKKTGKNCRFIDCYRNKE